MKNLAPAAAFLLLVTAAGAARADTLKVPSEAYETIQEAVDAAQEGDVVLVAKGTYAVTVVVAFKLGITIRGKPGAVLQPGAGETGIEILNGENLRISGFVIDGALNGITITDATDVEVKKVAVVDSVGSGITIATSSNVRIRSSKVTGAGNFGVQDSDSTDVVVEKCVFEDCTSDSVFLSAWGPAGSGSDGAVVSKNRISGGQSGVRVGGENLRVEKNRIEGVTDYGIYIDSSSGSSNAVIEKNRLSATPGGLYLYADNSTVSKNRIEGASLAEGGTSNTLDRNVIVDASIGISSGGTSVTIVGNVVRMSESNGINVFGIDAMLDRNRVFDAGTYGIYVQASGATLQRNSVARPVSLGIRINAIGALLEQNRVSGAGDIGFYITGTPNTLRENQARGSGLFDLADGSAEGVNTYEENRFGTTQFSYVD